MRRRWDEGLLLLLEVAGGPQDALLRLRAGSLWAALLSGRVRRQRRTPFGWLDVVRERASSVPVVLAVELPALVGRVGGALLRDLLGPAVFQLLRWLGWLLQGVPPFPWRSGRQ